MFFCFVGNLYIVLIFNIEDLEVLDYDISYF